MVRALREKFNPDTVSKDWVDATTFFVVRTSDNRIVGMVDIRHRLNYFLSICGGHIGYSVRPSERKKGYGTEILKQALEYGSRKIIVKCGGKLEKEFTYIDGKIIQVYWIDN